MLSQIQIEKSKKRSAAWYAKQKDDPNFKLKKAETDRARYLKYRPKFLAYSIQYAKEHKSDPAFVKSRYASTKNWYDKIKDNMDFKEKRSAKHLKRYGTTVEEYNLLLERQSMVCAICKKKETSVDKRTGLTKRLFVDHCHATNKIRGLLCQKCNFALGLFEDNLSSLSNAIEYLKAVN